MNEVPAIYDNSHATEETEKMINHAAMPTDDIVTYLQKEAAKASTHEKAANILAIIDTLPWRKIVKR